MAARGPPGLCPGTDRLGLCMEGGPENSIGTGQGVSDMAGAAAASAYEHIHCGVLSD